MTWVTIGQISMDSISGLVLKYPNVLFLNLTNGDLGTKVEFLKRALGRDVPEFLLKNPSYMTYIQFPKAHLGTCRVLETAREGCDQGGIYKLVQ